VKDLSVLIVTYNSRRDIGACLRSLVPAVGDGIDAEVVVIDNGSTDGTADVVRAEFPDVRLLALPTNRGFAGGIRRGLEASSGRFVLWMNPDSTYASGRIADVLSWMASHQGVGIVGGRVLEPDGAVQRSARAFPSYGAVIGARYSLLTKWFPNNPWSRRFLRTDLTYDSIAKVDWVSGAFLLHTRALSDRLGGPDEGFFMYFEDVDFCYRASQAGSEVFFHPGMTIVHRIGGSSQSAPAALLVARHRSLWRWYTKHFQRFWLKDAAVWAGVWVRCAALIAAGAVRGRRL
jgi:GT2 family glycosyltransferase